MLGSNTKLIILPAGPVENRTEVKCPAAASVDAKPQLSIFRFASYWKESQTPNRVPRSCREGERERERAAGGGGGGLRVEGVTENVK